MRLSEHFALDEATFSSTATRQGINNTPPVAILQNMQVAAVGMEKIRALLRQPIRIDSWYRCDALNAAVGGVGNSAHTDGFAVDFICPAFGTPMKIVNALIGNIEFDQLIEEGTWVHVSFAPAMRNMVLQAHFDAGKKTEYSRITVS